MAAADASSPQPPLSEQDVNVLLAQLGTVELSQEQKDHVRRAIEAKKRLKTMQATEERQCKTSACSRCTWVKSIGRRS